MIYADFNYYSEEYKGSVILDPEEFDRYIMRASVDIDYYTFGRAASHTDSELIKNCACAVAEKYQVIEYSMKRAATETPELQHESVGSYSRTYRSSSEIAAFAKSEIKDIINHYLAHTGLLYSGVKVCTHRIR